MKKEESSELMAGEELLVVVHQRYHTGRQELQNFSYSYRKDQGDSPDRCVLSGHVELGNMADTHEAGDLHLVLGGCLDVSTGRTET